MNATTLEERLIRYFAYRLPDEQMTISNLKRSMRRALENDYAPFRDQMIVDAMQLLEMLGIAERVSDRPMKWKKKDSNNA